MKKIPLTQGKFALIDDEDYKLISKYKWHYHSGYAARTLKTIRMHRVILNAKPEEEIDHINRNTLDNRRQNLRIASKSQNAHNKGVRKDNTSGQKGVHYNKDKKLWISRIQVENKRYYIGNYKTKDEAIMAYRKAQMEYHT